MGKTSLNNPFWNKHNLGASIRQTVDYFAQQTNLDKQHVEKTPARYIKALEEILSGGAKDPKVVLSTLFKSKFDQMIHVEEIEFFSMCAHHILPFMGKVHFAYIPKTCIVGLSKIPRLVDMYASRLQIQEEMAEQIVDSFQSIVDPLGCGVFIRATHFCCSARGIKKSCFMKTTALRGCFKKDSTKAEFLQAIR
jgi:GTP cyclohydrolase IA